MISFLSGSFNGFGYWNLTRMVTLKSCAFLWLKSPVYLSLNPQICGYTWNVIWRRFVSRYNPQNDITFVIKDQSETWIPRLELLDALVLARQQIRQVMSWLHFYFAVINEVQNLILHIMSYSKYLHEQILKVRYWSDFSSRLNLVVDYVSADWTTSFETPQWFPGPSCIAIFPKQHDFEDALLDEPGETRNACNHNRPQILSTFWCRVYIFIFYHSSTSISHKRIVVLDITFYQFRFSDRTDHCLFGFGLSSANSRVGVLI